MNILKNKIRYIASIGLITILLSTSMAFGLDYEATVIVPETTIRREKDFDSKQLDKLSMGTKVAVREISDDWYRVETLEGRNEGWIPSQEIVINDSLFKENNIKKGCVTASVLNVRLGPSTNNTKATKIRCGETVTIINTSVNTSDAPGEWYEVILNNNTKGWVHSDYIKIIHNFPEGIVNTDSVILKQRSDNDEGITNLKKGETVYIRDCSKDRYNIITSEDMEGWVENEYITVAPANVNRFGSSREIFGDVDAVTSKYLGKRYARGGNGPDSFDCSGFTSYILKTYYGEYLKSKKINLPRTSRAQATVGTPVSRENLAKGDLVFFSTAGGIGSSINHVGIYIGEGKIVHASTSRRGIVTDNLSDRYYNTRFMKAVRL